MKLFHGTGKVFDQFDSHFYGDNFSKGNYLGVYATPYQKQAEFWAKICGMESQLVLSFEIDDRVILWGDRSVSSIMCAERLCHVLSTIASQFENPSFLADRFLEKSPGSSFIQKLLDCEIVGENNGSSLITVVFSMFRDGYNLKPKANCKYKAKSAIGILTEELGYAAILCDAQDKYDADEVIIFDLSKISDVRLVSCTEDLRAKYCLKKEQIMIGAGNKPVAELSRPVRKPLNPDQRHKKAFG